MCKPNLLSWWQAVHHFQNQHFQIVHGKLFTITPIMKIHHNKKTVKLFLSQHMIILIIVLSLVETSHLLEGTDFIYFGNMIPTQTPVHMCTGVREQGNNFNVYRLHDVICFKIKLKSCWQVKTWKFSIFGGRCFFAVQPWYNHGARKQDWQIPSGFHAESSEYSLNVT